MYYKNVDYNNYKEMFDFLHNRFEYATLNSWNDLRSIANNVKLYNIPGINVSEAYQALNDDDYSTINLVIKDWNEDHPGYEVGFNGRSGGYLVLYSKDHNGHCFKDYGKSPVHYDTFEDWERDVKEGYGSLEEYKNELLEQVKLVQDFDKLCDDLVGITKSLTEDMKKRKELTKKYTATLRFQRYYYETLKDLKLHMLDMKKRGFAVFEYSSTDLYAEYEMNEEINSEIVLDEEGDEDFVYDNK